MTTSLRRHASSDLDLGMAIIAVSVAPLLLIDGDLAVVASSASFCRSFRLDPTVVPGAQLSALGEGEWGDPELRSLLNALISGKSSPATFEMSLGAHCEGSRQLRLHIDRICADAQHVRLLVTVLDNTNAPHCKGQTQNHSARAE